MLSQIVNRKKAVFAKQQVGYGINFTLGQNKAVHTVCNELLAQLMEMPWRGLTNIANQSLRGHRSTISRAE